MMDVCREVSLICATLFILNVVREGSCARQENICGTYNGRRLYLELGDKGVLYSGNTTAFVKPNQGGISAHDQCSIEIVTCPACVIKVSFLHLNLSPQCGNSAGGMGEHQCHCDYLWLSEPSYEEVSGASYCGFFQSSTIHALSYRSLTRSLSLTFLFTESHSNAFAVEFTAERNRLHFSGSPRISNIPQSINPGGEITSPFFPVQYPRDLSSEYTVHCDVQIGVRCRIRLLFLDYQLATVSTMKFYNLDGERQYIDSSSGASFRPPVILSSGPTLLIRFNANGGTSLGFKILYSFVTGTFDLTAIKPITYCGGFVENLGGAITMMNMVEPGKTVKTYDCIWVVKPLANYFHLKTHIYLKVVTFNNMADASEIVVRKGVTSDGAIIESVRYNSFQVKNSQSKVEHVVPLDVGFYVTLHGAFSASSRVAIVYSAFSFIDQFQAAFPSHRDCFAGSDFMCQNHRCISGHLSCDGFDHCGDNSDEPSECYHEWGSDVLDRRWYAKIPNYYFPKIEPYPDLKTATLVFIIGTFGLMMLIVTLIVLLYRMGSRGNEQRELQNHLQTISDFLAAESRPEETTPDEPPVYEAPPDYDEIIKLTPTLLPTSTPKHPHRKRRHPGTPLSKSSFSTNAENASAYSTKLEVALPPVHDDLSRRCSLPGSMLSTSTDALLSSIPSCPSTPAHSVTAVPDSPPPPYAESPFVIQKLEKLENYFLRFPIEDSSLMDIPSFVVPLSDERGSPCASSPTNAQLQLSLFPAEEPSNSVCSNWASSENPSTSFMNPWGQVESTPDVFSHVWTGDIGSPHFSKSWVQFKSSDPDIASLKAQEEIETFSETVVTETLTSPEEDCETVNSIVATLGSFDDSTSSAHSCGTTEIAELNLVKDEFWDAKSININDNLKKFDVMIARSNAIVPGADCRRAERLRIRSLDSHHFKRLEQCSPRSSDCSYGILHNCSCLQTNNTLVALDVYLRALDFSSKKIREDRSSSDDYFQYIESIAKKKSCSRNSSWSV